MAPDVAAYIALAREDLGAATGLRDAFLRHAAFCLEQAAEKLIKAALTREGILAALRFAANAVDERELPLRLSA